MHKRMDRLGGIQPVFLHSEILPAFLLAAEIDRFQFPVSAFLILRILPPQLGRGCAMTDYVHAGQIPVFLPQKAFQSVDLAPGSGKQHLPSGFQIFFYLLQDITGPGL